MYAMVISVINIDLYGTQCICILWFICNKSRMNYVPALGKNYHIQEKSNNPVKMEL